MGLHSRQWGLSLRSTALGSSAGTCGEAQCGLWDSENPELWSGRSGAWGRHSGSAPFGMRLFPRAEWPVDAFRDLAPPCPWLAVPPGSRLWPMLALLISSGSLTRQPWPSCRVFAAIPGRLRGGAGAPLPLVLPGLLTGRAGLHAGARRRGPRGLRPWRGGPWGTGPASGQCGAAPGGAPPVPGGALG